MIAHPNKAPFTSPNVTIEHLSTSKDGLQIFATSVGRTAGKALQHLDSGQRADFKRAMQGEMKYRGVDRVRSARSAWRDARESGQSPATTEELRRTFEKARADYINTGKKVSLRNTVADPEDPDVLRADAAITDYVTYNLFSRPEATGTLAEMAIPSAVAMALTTADGRLIIQHRAVETVDFMGTKRKPGNGLFADIPGASVAGMADASLREENRKPGTPDTVTTETFYKNILKESGEELGLAPNQLEPKLVGLAREYRPKPHTELLLLGRTPLTAEEVRENAKVSTRNKNLAPEDLEEKFMDIEASPEAIVTLLTKMHTPLPPTHSAAYIAAGHEMVLERDGQDAADAWIAAMEDAVAVNYKAIDQMVKSYYEKYPEARSIIPERYWNKRAPERTEGYNPAYTPPEQGLPELEDELVRVGLIEEERQLVDQINIYDVDGVITDPTTKKITHPEILDAIAGQLQRGEQVIFNTGRSTRWVVANVVEQLQGLLSDRKLLENLSVIGEKGNTATFYDHDGVAHHWNNGKVSVPPEFISAAKELAARYGHIMGNLDPKQTMLSLEMNDGESIDDYQRLREPFIKELDALIDKFELSGEYKIDATTIAVDVESPHAGKALGAARALEILRYRGLAFANARFVAFGDSTSDVAMAQELSRHGLRGEFIFVGDTMPTQKKGYETVGAHHFSGYSSGTLEYFKSRRLV